MGGEDLVSQSFVKSSSDSWRISEQDTAKTSKRRPWTVDKRAERESSATFRAGGEDKSIEENQTN